MFTISDLSSRCSSLSESLLLSCLDDFLVLPDFLVGVDLWDGRDHFALHLLDICIAGCNYLHYCASPRTSPCLCRCPLVCLCLPLTLLFSCLPLAVLFSALFITPRLRVLLAVLVPWLLYFFLVTAGSLAVVPCLGFSPLALWLVVPSVILSFSESLCGRLRLRGSFLASLHHHSALRPS